MKKKKIILTVFYLILIGLIVYLVTIGKDDLKNLLDKNNTNNNNSKDKTVQILEKLNYKKETIDLFKEDNIENIVANKNIYSKTLEEVIKEEDFNKDYVEHYLNIEYKDYPSFLTFINTFITKGYQDNEINLFLNKLNENSVKVLSERDYNQKISAFLDYSYFKEDNLERYLNYEEKHQDETNENIVTYVNIGLDCEFYTNIKDINSTDANSLTVLVNKYNKLPDNYVPKNLTSLGKEYTKWGNNLKMVDVAAEAFRKMADDAKKENLYILASSTYRSIADQKWLYNSYIQQENGNIASVDTFSARYGHSEHHTGLAVDYATREKDYNRIEGSKEDTWIRANAYKYGFILRYPKDKVNITGYKYEPWHLRYFGIDLAKTLYENNLTYEEYLARL